MEIGRSSKKVKNTTHEETTDFISQLPDPILVHILSFLPIEDAIKTVLLRRFGNLWRSIPVLDLNECRYHECGADLDREALENQNFLDTIHLVSNRHDVGVLDRLSLKIWFPLTFSKQESDFNDPDLRDYAEMEKATSSDIGKLIGYAIEREVKVLDLSFRGCGYVWSLESYVLPDVFRSNYLEDLRLNSCDIKLCREISLKALRVLVLNNVSSLRNGTMENILLGCPFLEELSLIDCYGLRKLFCNNPNLKKLMLTLSTDQMMLYVYCPHVMSLEIAGWIECATLSTVSSLIDVSISFSYLFKSELRPYEDVERLLEKVSRCKTFTPCEHTILMLTVWNFMDVPCASYRWKNLIIKLYLTKWHHPGLSWLFKSSLYLETLTMYIRPISGSYFEREAAGWISAYDFDKESYWDLQEARFPCLECITIYGCVNEPCVLQMLKFLLKNATKLQKMVISVEDTFDVNWCDTGKLNNQFTSEKQLEVVKELLKFPRASSEAMIYFS